MSAQRVVLLLAAVCYLPVRSLTIASVANPPNYTSNIIDTTGMRNVALHKPYVYDVVGYAPGQHTNTPRTDYGSELNQGGVLAWRDNCTALPCTLPIGPWRGELTDGVNFQADAVAEGKWVFDVWFLAIAHSTEVSPPVKIIVELGSAYRIVRASALVANGAPGIGIGVESFAVHAKQGDGEFHGFGNNLTHKDTRTSPLHAGGFDMHTGSANSNNMIVATGVHDDLNSSPVVFDWGTDSWYALVWLMAEADGPVVADMVRFTLTPVSQVKTQIGISELRIWGIEDTPSPPPPACTTGQLEIGTAPTLPVTVNQLGNITTDAFDISLEVWAATDTESVVMQMGTIKLVLMQNQGSTVFALNSTSDSTVSLLSTHPVSLGQWHIVAIQTSTNASGTKSTWLKVDNIGNGSQYIQKQTFEYRSGTSSTSSDCNPQDGFTVITTEKDCRAYSEDRGFEFSTGLVTWNFCIVLEPGAGSGMTWGGQVLFNDWRTNFNCVSQRSIATTNNFDPSNGASSLLHAGFLGKVRLSDGRVFDNQEAGLPTTITWKGLNSSRVQGIDTSLSESLHTTQLNSGEWCSVECTNSTTDTITTHCSECPVGYAVTTSTHAGNAFHYCSNTIDVNGPGMLPLAGCYWVSGQGAALRGDGYCLSLGMCDTTGLNIGTVPTLPVMVDQLSGVTADAFDISLEVWAANNTESVVMQMGTIKLVLMQSQGSTVFALNSTLDTTVSLVSNHTVSLGQWHNITIQTSTESTWLMVDNIGSQYIYESTLEFIISSSATCVTSNGYTQTNTAEGCQEFIDGLAGGTQDATTGKDGGCWYTWSGGHWVRSPNKPFGDNWNCVSQRPIGSNPLGATDGTSSVLHSGFLGKVRLSDGRVFDNQETGLPTTITWKGLSSSGVQGIDTSLSGSLHTTQLSPGEWCSVECTNATIGTHCAECPVGYAVTRSVHAGNAYDYCSNTTGNNKLPLAGCYWGSSMEALRGDDYCLRQTCPLPDLVHWASQVAKPGVHLTINTSATLFDVNQTLALKSLNSTYFNCGDIRCTEGGNWSSDTTCSLMGCDSGSLTTSSLFKPNCSGEVAHGDTCTFTTVNPASVSNYENCDVSTCGDQGQWSLTSGECQPRNCTFTAPPDKTIPSFYGSFGPGFVPEWQEENCTNSIYSMNSTNSTNSTNQSVIVPETTCGSYKGGFVQPYEWNCTNQSTVAPGATCAYTGVDFDSTPFICVAGSEFQAPLLDPRNCHFDMQNNSRHVKIIGGDGYNNVTISPNLLPSDPSHPNEEGVVYVPTLCQTTLVVEGISNSNQAGLAACGDVFGTDLAVPSNLDPFMVHTNQTSYLRGYTTDTIMLCISGGLYHPPQLVFRQSNCTYAQPDIPGASFSCDNGEEVSPWNNCTITKPGHVCDTMHCDSGYWRESNKSFVHPAPTCQPLPCDYVEPPPVHGRTSTNCNTSSKIPSGTVCEYTLHKHDCVSDYECFATHWTGGVQCTPQNCTLDCAKYPDMDDSHPLYQNTLGFNNTVCPPGVFASVAQGSIKSGTSWGYTALGHVCDSHTCINGTTFRVKYDTNEVEDSVAQCEPSACLVDDLLNPFEPSSNRTLGTNCSNVPGFSLAHGHVCALETFGFNCYGYQKCSFGNWTLYGATNNSATPTVDVAPMCTPQPCEFKPSERSPVDFVENGIEITCGDKQILNNVTTFVDSGDTCIMRRAGYVCTEPVKCTESQFENLGDDRRLGNCNTEKSCNRSDITFLTDNTVFGQDCPHDNVDGDHKTCTFYNPEYYCENTTCSLGNWTSNVVSCETPKPCTLVSQIVTGAKFANCTRNNTYSHGSVCGVTRDGYTCTPFTCDKGSFTPTSSSCSEDDCIFSTAFAPTAPGSNLAATSTCINGNTKSAGDSCEYSIPGYNCSLTTDTCREGKWVNGSAECVPNPCVYTKKDFPLSTVSADSSAYSMFTPQSNCTLNASVAHLDVCTFDLSWHTCESTVCRAEEFSGFNSSHPKCTEDGCVWTTEWLNYSSVPNGTLHSTCGEGENVASGQTCKMKVSGYSCGSPSDNDGYAKLYCRLGRWWRVNPNNDGDLHNNTLLFFGDGIWDNSDKEYVNNKTAASATWNLNQNYMPRCETIGCKHNSLSDHQRDNATAQCNEVVWAPLTAPFKAADPSAGFCEFTKDGHHCNDLKCLDGNGWNGTGTVQCWPNPCLQSDMNLDLSLNWGLNVERAPGVSDVCTNGSSYVKSGVQCSFEVPSSSAGGRQYTCEPSSCLSGVWTPQVDNFKPCKPHNCTYNSSMHTQYHHAYLNRVADSNCSTGQHKDSTVCVTNLDDFECQAMECQASVWEPPSPQCSPLKCPFDATIQAAIDRTQAAPAWWNFTEQKSLTNCTGSSINPGGVCKASIHGHQCGSISCYAGATWRRSFPGSVTQFNRTSPRPECIPLGCDLEQLSLPSGAHYNCTPHMLNDNGEPYSSWVKSGASCNVTKPGFTCDKTECYASEFKNNGNLVCLPNPCQLTPNDIPHGAQPSCSGTVESGGVCSFTKFGHSCSSIQCKEGKFVNASTCSPDPCPVKDMLYPSLPDQGVLLTYGWELNATVWDKDTITFDLPFSGSPKCSDVDAKVLSGHACGFNHSKHVCTPNLCINGSWTNTAQCTASSCNSTNVPSTKDSENDCTGDTAISNGQACYNIQVGFSCEPTVCVRGEWMPHDISTQQCDQNPCTLDIPSFVNQIIPKGADQPRYPTVKCGGSVTETNGTINPGSRCVAQEHGFDCGSGKICKEGKLPATICTKAMCSRSELEISGGPTGSTCPESTDRFNHSHTCSFTKDHHTCTSSQCLYGNWTNNGVISCVPLPCFYNQTRDAPLAFDLPGNTNVHGMPLNQLTDTSLFISNCSGVSSVPPGGNCWFEQSGYDCDSISCTHEHFDHRLGDQHFDPKCHEKSCGTFSQNGGANLAITPLTLPGSTKTYKLEMTCSENEVSSGTICKFTIGDGNYECDSAICRLGEYNRTNITCPAPKCKYTEEVKGEALNTTCSIQQTYDSGHICNHTKIGYKCKSSMCTWSGFDPPQVSCSENPCDYDPQTVPHGADTNCSAQLINRQIDDGQVCTHNRSGYTCESVTCGVPVAGKLDISSPVCIPNPCNRNELPQLPLEATTDCLDGNDVESGGMCNVTLTGYDCNKISCFAGEFSGPSVCTPKRCTDDPLSTEERLAGAALSCGENVDVSNGTVCNVTRGGHTCGSFECVLGVFQQLGTGGACMPNPCDLSVISSITNGVRVLNAGRFEQSDWQQDNDNNNIHTVFPHLQPPCAGTSENAQVASNTTCPMTFPFGQYKYNCGSIKCHEGEWGSQKVACPESACDFAELTASVCVACPNTSHIKDSGGACTTISHDTQKCIVGKPGWDCNGNANGVNRELGCYAGIWTDETGGALGSVYTDNSCIKITSAPTSSPTASPSLSPTHAPSMAPTLPPTFGTDAPAEFAMDYLAADRETGRDIIEYVIDGTMTLPTIRCNDFVGTNTSGRLESAVDMTRNMLDHSSTDIDLHTSIEIDQVLCNGVNKLTSGTSRRMLSSGTTDPDLNIAGAQLTWSLILHYTMVDTARLYTQRMPVVLTDTTSSLLQLQNMSTTLGGLAMATLQQSLIPNASLAVSAMYANGISFMSIGINNTRPVVDTGGCANTAVRLNCATQCDTHRESLPLLCVLHNCTQQRISHQQSVLHQLGLRTCEHFNATQVPINDTSTTSALNQNQTQASQALLSDQSVTTIQLNTQIAFSCPLCSPDFHSAITSTDSPLAAAIAVSLTGSLLILPTDVTVAPVTVAPVTNTSGPHAYSITVAITKSSLDEATQRGSYQSSINALASLQQSIDRVATPEQTTTRDQTVHVLSGWHSPLLIYLTTMLHDAGVAYTNSTKGEFIEGISLHQLSDATFTAAHTVDQRYFPSDTTHVLVILGVFAFTTGLYYLMREGNGQQPTSQSKSEVEYHPITPAHLQQIP